MKKSRKKKLNEKRESPPETDVQPDLDPELTLALSPEEGLSPSAQLRTVGLYGEIDEERASEVVFSLLYMQEVGQTLVPVDEEDPDAGYETRYEPFTFLISTHGGLAADMFAIYDTMRMLRKEVEISTFGLGKVMSAGVLLLAAGTKGKRKIGKNCRIMMHSVMGGPAGTLSNLENEMDEIRWLQQRHIECLIEETNMTKRQLKKMLDRKVNVYLTAEEAVELGIADEVV